MDHDSETAAIKGVATLRATNGAVHAMFRR